MKEAVAMEARELESPTPTYHLVPEARQPREEEGDRMLPQQATETMQLKKEFVLKVKSLKVAALTQQARKKSLLFVANQ